MQDQLIKGNILVIALPYMNHWFYAMKPNTI